MTFHRDLSDNFEFALLQITTILWFKCHEKEITQKIPYESLPWWQLLIHLVGYHEEIDVLLSEYQYFNPLF